MSARKAESRKHAHAATAAPPARRWLVWVVVAAGVAAYANSLAGVFLFDDYKHILANDRIRHLGQLGRILFSTSRPILELTLAFNYRLGEFDPRGYHAFNIMIHLLAGMTLFGLVRRTLLLEPFRRRHARAAPWLALAVALLWTIHPLQTQSVTYIVQRSESLMGLSYLLTVYCVLRGDTSPRRRPWYGAAILACALGMGCKAVMVTAPVIVLLYDSVFLSRSVRGALRKRWGLYLGLGASWGVLVACGVVTSVLFRPPQPSVTVGFGYQGATPWEYFLTQPGVVLHYLRLALVPHPLCLDYQWPLAKAAPAVVPPMMVVGALLLATVWAAGRRSPLGFLGLWFFAVLAPTSSFVPIKDIAFEHRMYLPLAAVIVLGVLAVRRILIHAVDLGVLSTRSTRWIQGALVTVLTMLYGVLTLARNADYHDEVAMWRDVVAKRPANARAWNLLGVVLGLRRDYEASAKALRKAVAIDPSLAAAHINLCKSLAQLGSYAEAIPACLAGLQTQPDKTDAYDTLGYAYWKTGNIPKAIEAYRQAARLDPNDAEHRLNLAAVLLEARQADQAIEQLWGAVRLAPSDFRARLRLARALDGQQQLDEAVIQYRAASELRPADAEVHFRLGNALRKRGQLTGALEAYTIAVRRNPRSVASRFNRGTALLELGRTDAAVAELTAVLKLDARHVPARYHLGRALEAQGRTMEAIAQFRRALELDPDHRASHDALARLAQPP